MWYSILTDKVDILCGFEVVQNNKDSISKLLRNGNICLTCSWSCGQTGIAGYGQPEHPLQLHLVPSVHLLLLLPLQRPQSPNMGSSSICPSIRNKWSQMCSVSVHLQVPACLPILRRISPSGSTGRESACFTLLSSHKAREDLGEIEIRNLLSEK